MGSTAQKGAGERRHARVAKKKRVGDAPAAGIGGEEVSRRHNREGPATSSCCSRRTPLLSTPLRLLRYPLPATVLPAVAMISSTQ